MGTVDHGVCQGRDRPVREQNDRASGISREPELPVTGRERRLVEGEQSQDFEGRVRQIRRRGWLKKEKNGCIADMIGGSREQAGHSVSSTGVVVGVIFFDYHLT